MNNSPSLISKVQPSHANALEIEDKLYQANLCVAEVIKDSSGWIRETLEAITELETQLRTGASDQEITDALYLVAHDLRGQAEYFDFLLLARLGASVCSQLDQLPNEQAVSRELSALFIQIVTYCLHHNLRGEGDGNTDQLLTAYARALVVTTDRLARAG